MKTFAALLVLLFPVSVPAFSQQAGGGDLRMILDERIDQIMGKAIEWRRHFHQFPELSNQEFKTAAYITEHLEGLGLEVSTGIAGTGVTGLLVGGEPGPVVALRADMDALPVTEALDLPFSSKVTTIYNGQETGVMHACGHDAHMAILMATAEVLSAVRDRLPGSVKFIFQPAEEGAFDAESWGAELMILEGVLEHPRPDVIFGLHVGPDPSGAISISENAFMASVDNFRIVVRGKGSHGAMPWLGVDPVLAAAAIVQNLQGIVSRNTELSNGAAVITVGSIHGGNRNNIIPEEVEMLGTIRTHSEGTRQLIHNRITEVSELTAAAYGAAAEVTIDRLYPALINHADVCRAMMPALEDAAGTGNVHLVNPFMTAEDFAYYLQEIPGIYFFLGARPKDTDPGPVEANHSPRFNIDEDAMKTGIRAFVYMILEYAKE